MKSQSKPDFEEVMNSEEIYRIRKKIHFPPQIPNPRSQDRLEKGDNRYPLSNNKGLEYNKYKSAPPPQDFNKPSKNFENNKQQSLDYRNPPSHHQIEELNPNCIIDNASGFSHKPSPSEGKRSKTKTQSNLMNLISKNKNKSNNEEIDLFEDNEPGDRNTQDLENYWNFLDSNKINKNLAVIPIEDDESPKIDLGLHKYPLKDLAKWNRKRWDRTYMPPNKKPQELEIQEIIDKEEETERKRRERAPWMNCYEMRWKKRDVTCEMVVKRKPKVIKLE